MMKLYISARSPFARRSRILLEELKIPHEVVVINVFDPPAEYFKVNPMGRIPALILPTQEVLIESHEIKEYFLERHRTHSIFQFGGTREATHRLVSGLAVGIMEYSVNYFLETTRPQGFVQSQDLLEYKDRIVRSLDRLAEIHQHANVGNKHSDYLNLGHYTACDIDVAAALTYCDLRVGTELVSKYPELRRYLTQVNERPAFKKTLPPA